MPDTSSGFDTFAMYVQFPDDLTQNDMYVVRVDPLSEFYLIKFAFNQVSSTEARYLMTWMKKFYLSQTFVLSPSALLVFSSK